MCHYVHRIHFCLDRANVKMKNGHNQFLPRALLLPAFQLFLLLAFFLHLPQQQILESIMRSPAFLQLQGVSSSTKSKGAMTKVTTPFRFNYLFMMQVALQVPLLVHQLVHQLVPHLLEHLLVPHLLEHLLVHQLLSLVDLQVGL